VKEPAYRVTWQVIDILDENVANWVIAQGISAEGKAGDKWGVVAVSTRDNENVICAGVWKYLYRTPTLCLLPDKEIAQKIADEFTTKGYIPSEDKGWCLQTDFIEIEGENEQYDTWYYVMVSNLFYAEAVGGRLINQKEMAKFVKQTHKRYRKNKFVIDDLRSEFGKMFEEIYTLCFKDKSISFADIVRSHPELPLLLFELRQELNPSRMIITAAALLNRDFALFCALSIRQYANIMSESSLHSQHNKELKRLKPPLSPDDFMMLYCAYYNDTQLQTLLYPHVRSLLPTIDVSNITTDDDGEDYDDLGDEITF
jgi:hypothetical protein